MTRHVRWSVALALLTSLSGCASERDPINRVQPEALQKSFFVGPSLISLYDEVGQWATVAALVAAGSAALLFVTRRARA